MIEVGIIGATGYAGSQLTAILAKHPQVHLSHLASHSYAGEKMSDIYPGLAGSCDLVLEEEDLESFAKRCAVVFLALPAGIAAKEVTQSVVNSTLLIDLGADFRLKDPACYEQWYKKPAPSQQILSQAVYGLCELCDHDLISKSSLIANPGCYTTCSILSLAPLLKYHLVESEVINVNALSGVSGAGRGEKVANLFCEVNSSCKAYGVSSHRHTPEIEQALGELSGQKVTVQFTPHLVPMNRGILATCQAKLKAGVNQIQVDEAYHNMYDGKQFVHLMGKRPPETRFVLGTNRVDIGYVIDERTGCFIAMGALDNLVKGAAGQAVQNMNIHFGLEENMGLELLCANPY
ncbi:MAG: N-acetyl-gamma-glutamyl-phosphate reductase [Spirochaetia bacterium]|nr:N-acetyl-gamma-glutamyl-phosphate reductase [Spirochaetia bacterium]